MLKAESSGSCFTLFWLISQSGIKLPAVARVGSCPDAHHGTNPIRGYFLTEMAEEVPSDLVSVVDHGLIPWSLPLAPYPKSIDQ